MRPSRRPDSPDNEQRNETRLRPKRPELASANPDPKIKGRLLLRKEVIQPLVPQRLPCYDFIPVTRPTFDACPHCWLARRLRVGPAPMM